MVGVPKSKGCATCRKRKIRCDERTPSCLKCIESRFSCPGYPSRLKFQDEGISLRRKCDSLNAHCKPSGPLRLAGAVVKGEYDKFSFHQLGGNIKTHNPLRTLVSNTSVRMVPLSPADRLAYQFLGTFKSDLPRGKSLIAFGKFVPEMPGHVGIHKAFDLSLEALCLAHSSLLTGKNENLVQSRHFYALALIELRYCLGDPQRATSAETLCATMMLGIYELFASTEKSAPVKHLGGASRLIQIRGPARFNDSFTYQMLRAKKFMVVLVAIMNQRPCFLNSPDWKEVLHRDVKEARHPFDSLFSLVLGLPDILNSFQKMKLESKPSIYTNDLRIKGVALRQELQRWSETPEQIALWQTSLHSTSMPVFPLQFSYVSNKAAALFCLYRATLILVNNVIIHLSNADTGALRLENQIVATEICQSYLYSTEFSPLGNFYMGFSLRVVYMVFDEQEKKDWILQRMNDPSSTSEGNMDNMVTEAELETGFDYLKLKVPLP